jgi:hypothetical protein
VNDTIFKEAEKLFARPEIQTYQNEQLAIRLNFERLKAERQAREADQDRR